MFDISFRNFRNLFAICLLANFRPIRTYECVNETTRTFVVALTNEYRSRHEDTSPLIYDASLEDTYSCEWADTLEKSNVLYHSGYTGVGENIAFVYQDNMRVFNILDAIRESYTMFYDDEIINYDFDAHAAIQTRVVGHFTQIVWRETKRMGFGFKLDESNGRFSLVYNFAPPGNYFGRYHINVGRVKFDQHHDRLKPPPPPDGPSDPKRPDFPPPEEEKEEVIVVDDGSNEPETESLPRPPPSPKYKICSLHRRYL